MEVLSSTNSHVYNPYPHRDPYGLDSLYISPVQEEEVWNLSSFHKSDLLSFSLLALRSCVHDRIWNSNFRIIGTSLELRKSISKKKWLMSNLPQAWKSQFPTLVGLGESVIPFELDLDISLRVDWKDSGKEAGFGLITNNQTEFFPKILDSIINYNAHKSRVYLRTTRQSFLYVPNIGAEDKKGLFIQDKDGYGFPEFYYYWIPG